MDLLPPEIWLDISEHCNQQTRIRLALACSYLFQVLKPSFTKSKDSALSFMQEALRLGTRAYLNEIGVSPTWMDLLRSGNLTLVQQQHQSTPLTKDLLEADKCLLLRTAVVSGNVALVEWLLETFSLEKSRLEECNQYAFRHAARKGRLEMLRWLVKCLGRYCWTESAADAYVYAVKEGHLDVADWLQRKFLDNAGDHCLDQKHKIRLTKFAVEKNNPDILHQLWRQDHYCFCEQRFDWHLYNHLLYTMCRKNYFECLKVFCSSYHSNYCYSNMVKWSINAGHVNILRYLLTRQGEYQQKWTKEMLLELAVKRPDVQEWVESHWPLKDVS